MSDNGPLGAATIRRLLDEHGVVPAKALGQNFVIDPNTTERIARLAGIGPGDRVLEIGAGVGSLTRALHATGAEVTAIEIDRRLVEILTATLPPTVKVIQADALRTEWREVLEVDSDRPWVLVANLPYNVAAPLVLDLLITTPSIARMVVMVQREVAERLAAAPGSKGCGAVSVRVSYFASAQIVGAVSSTVFFPRPRVESALVRIDRRPVLRVDDRNVAFGDLDRLLRAAFAGRRKMLRRSLAGLVGLEGLEAAGVSPSSRPEELDLETWGKLAQWTPSGPSPTQS